MKVVINKCYGGFSLSPEGVRRLAELKGRDCYFFVTGRNSEGELDWDIYVRVTPEQAKEAFSFFAFDVPDAAALAQLKSNNKRDFAESNKWYAAHMLDTRPEPRHDPDLVKVVEELGDKANGKCAELQVVDIPVGENDYEIAEYDGMEHVAEKHKTWG